MASDAWSLLDELSRALRIGEASAAGDVRLEGLSRIVDGMGGQGPDRHAPAREVMARLGDRWSALLLLVLSTGTFRHATLKRVVSLLAAEDAISQRMLTLRLRALERDGFVARKVHETVPPRVEYSLTELGEELSGRLADMISWIESKDSAIRAARKRFSD